MEVRWSEILLEALNKSIRSYLRNTVRGEVTPIFVTEEEESRDCLFWYIVGYNLPPEREVQN